MSVSEEGGRLTPGELRFASWWVRHQIGVRRFGYGSLIGLSVLAWGYAGWGLLDAYAISYPRESRLTRDIALNQQLLTALQQDQPQRVSFSEVLVGQGTDNRFDLSVEMTNPNPHWWAEFNYRFSLSGEQTPIRSGYVLPQSRQILTELGYRPTAKGGRSASLIIENVRWHRLDVSSVGAQSFKDFAGSRLAISFQDVKYDTDITLGTKKVGQTSFTLVNRSAYGFWNLDLLVRLYRGGSPVAMNKITLTNLSPGERRLVQLTWLDNLPSITKTEIIPQVNLLDPNVFLPTEYFKTSTENLP